MREYIMNEDYTIRLETPADRRTVENLIRESFWNVYRPGCSELCTFCAATRLLCRSWI